MSRLSAMISRVNGQHYEALPRAANATGMWSERNIASRS